MARIASVMNDRYHAFGRQGFGAIYGSKNLKAIVVGGKARCRSTTRRASASCARGSPRVPARHRAADAADGRDGQAQEAGWAGCTACSPSAASRSSRRSRRCASSGRTAAPRRRSRSPSRTATRRSRTGGRRRARLPAVEEGLEARRRPGRQDTSPRSSRAAIARRRARASWRSKRRGLADVRRPDYETIVGFGANLSTTTSSGHRLPRRLQPLRHRRGELVGDAGLGVRGDGARRARRFRPRRHRHAVGQRRGGARAHDQDGGGRGLRRVAAPRRRRAPPRISARQRRVRRPRPRPGARVPRPALHLADGRHLHRRPDPGPPHRRLGVVERDVRHEVPAAPGRPREGGRGGLEGDRGQGSRPGAHSATRTRRSTVSACACSPGSPAACRGSSW
jgi:hypothetical protein